MRVPTDTEIQRERERDVQGVLSHSSEYFCMDVQEPEEKGDAESESCGTGEVML